ncbi:MAG: hypothetical protein NVSMB6_23960 [Burkholderiaceae bacterium]
MLADPVIVSDLQGQILFWNAAAEATYGWLSGEAVGCSIGLLLGQVDPRLQETISQALTNDNRWQGELTRLDKNGCQIVVDCQQVLQAFGGNVSDHVVDISHDNSTFKQQESRLRDTARILQAVMDNTSSYIHVRDVNGRFLYVNEEYEKVFDVPKASVVGKLIEEVFPPDIAAIRREMHETVIRSPVDLHAEIVQVVHGSVQTFMDVKSPLLDDDGNVYAVYCIGTDITQRKAMESRILQLAHYDAVTKLPNRILFQDRLGEALKKSARTGESVALLFLDLDRFKDVNDTLGHDTGDRLLNAAGLRLRGCVRDCDTVARMGGDEFTVILENVCTPTDVDSIAQKMLKEVLRPFSIEGKEIQISASMGVTIFPRDADNAGALLKNADQAMYTSKRSGPGSYCFYTESMNRAAATRLRIIGDLKCALRNGHFRLLYQPIVSLSDGLIHKAEALIRWEHPVYGVINPTDFIPIAEETGDIIAIGDWVFREAVRQCADWRCRFDPGFQISINTSPAQYHNRGIDIAGWTACLAASTLHGNAVVVEITEGLLMDASDVIRKQLRAFSDAGMQIALDDFGTGYSSLSYLKKFDVDYLKIDRTFVTGLTAASDDLALCEAIIAMAHRLGLHVIAEGIETGHQRDLLAAAGCDYGQGYLFSRPVAPADLELRLRV